MRVRYYYDLGGDLTSDTEGCLVQLCTRCAAAHIAEVQPAAGGEDGAVCELCEDLALDEPAPVPAPAPGAAQLPALAPRPFSQMARRDYRLYGNTLPGLRGALSAAPWYRQRRRRPLFELRRREARLLRQGLAEIYQRYPCRGDQPCEVA